jgi:hypothetical protein
MVAKLQASSSLRVSRIASNRSGPPSALYNVGSSLDRLNASTMKVKEMITAGPGPGTSTAPALAPGPGPLQSIDIPMGGNVPAVSPSVSVPHGSASGRRDNGYQRRGLGYGGNQRKYGGEKVERDGEGEGEGEENTSSTADEGSGDSDRYRRKVARKQRDKLKRSVYDGTGDVNILGKEELFSLTKSFPLSVTLKNNQNHQLIVL